MRAFQHLHIGDVKQGAGQTDRTRVVDPVDINGGGRIELQPGAREVLLATNGDVQRVLTERRWRRIHGRRAIPQVLQGLHAEAIHRVLVEHVN